MAGNKMDYSVATKRGERRDGLFGLNYNTNRENVKKDPLFHTKRRTRHAANRKRRGDLDNENRNAKVSKQR